MKKKLQGFKTPVNCGMSKTDKTVEKVERLLSPSDALSKLIRPRISRREVVRHVSARNKTVSLVEAFRAKMEADRAKQLARCSFGFTTGNVRKAKVRKTQKVAPKRAKIVKPRVKAVFRKVKVGSCTFPSVLLPDGTVQSFRLEETARRFIRETNNFKGEAK